MAGKFGAIAYIGTSQCLPRTRGRVWEVEDLWQLAGFIQGMLGVTLGFAVSSAERCMGSENYLSLVVNHPSLCFHQLLCRLIGRLGG